MPTLNEIYDDLEDEDKIILYALGVLDYEPLRSKVKLEKLLFLVSNVFENYSDLLDFDEYLLGPYSEIVNDALENLIRSGVVGQQKNHYYLTDLGMQLYDRLKPQEELVQVLEDFKKFLNDLRDDEVLAFVYVTYPRFQKESKKWDNLKKNRIDIAISLFKKNKVSLSKAVEISGLNPTNFMSIIKRRGVRTG
jgi:uncharacterized protein YwgA